MRHCREPLGYATISKKLVFFKKHTPIKIFKPKLVKILYHKGVNSSIASYIKRLKYLQKYGIMILSKGVRIWQCGIRGEVVKSAAMAVYIAISTRAMQSAELTQVLSKRQRTLQSP